MKFYGHVVVFITTLFIKGKEAGHKMEAANKKAAALTLKNRNDGHGENYLDLHGLHLDEAMAALTERYVLVCLTTKS